MASNTENLTAKRKVGRPRKEDLYGGHIRAAEDRIADRLPELIDNLFALAAGVWVEEVSPGGEKRVVYQRPPCRQSNEYLLNRIMGRPTEVIQTHGPDDEQTQTLREYLAEPKPKKKKAGPDRPRVRREGGEGEGV